jgi:hypothetical protein
VGRAALASQSTKGVDAKAACRVLENCMLVGCAWWLICLVVVTAAGSCGAGCSVTVPAVRIGNRPQLSNDQLLCLLHCHKLLLLLLTHSVLLLLLLLLLVQVASQGAVSRAATRRVL